MTELVWERVQDDLGQVSKGVARLIILDEYGHIKDIRECHRDWLWETTDRIRELYPDITWEDTGLISLPEHIEATIL